MAVTDRSGYYDVTDLPAGGYFVTAHKEGWIFLPEQHYVQVGGGVWTGNVDFIGYAEGTDPPVY